MYRLTGSPGPSRTLESAVEPTLDLSETEALINRFERWLPFALDSFQREAMRELERNRGVLVCAPTSSGKTVVAEYAIQRALEQGYKAIYTTPLKALSNQKFRDLCRQLGESQVGLVTGENSINDEAPVVVMTTEVLRNLLYEDMRRLDLVRYVVLDEVHYIDDFPRGSVWEEIIIQAPPEIKLIGLSATIGNHGEIAQWMSQNRGPIAVVVHEERPVELRVHLAMRNRFYTLLGPEGQIDQRTWERAVEEEEASHRISSYSRMPSNDLLRIIDELGRQGMLPAIYFIFSRRGCREALQRCALHGLDLTSAEEKLRIVATVNAHFRNLSAEDEMALFRRMLDSDMLERGLAVHHAGLMPHHKELVEDLFQQGLLKVVFATETLALGINMPAKAVVVSSFSKFDGVSFGNLTTGELTQLMGRAGRRGIDTIGHGIILKESDVEIGTIYEVALGESLVVESKFLPNYNMVLNLLRIYPREQAEELMKRSLGQFQRSRAAAETQARMQNLRSRLEDILRMWDCQTCTIEDMRRYFELEERRRANRIELRRLRREMGGGGRGWRKANRHSQAARAYNALNTAGRELLAQQRSLPVVRCPDFGEHVGQIGEVHRIERELAAGTEQLESRLNEYARKFGRLSRILTETGFLEQDRPTPKGVLASKVYGENALVVVESAWQGYLDGLTPPELCSLLAMLCAEDRERGPRGPRRFPTPAVTQAARAVRNVYYRFADLERDLEEPNLRPLSFDYIDFAYRWAEGEAMDQIPLPPGADIGDAIRSMKALYSMVRQLDWALHDAGQEHRDLHQATRAAVRAMERDVIKRA